MNDGPESTHQTRHPVENLRSSSDVSDALRAMYGIVAPRSEGVIHVTSVSDASGGLVTMNINDRTPTCAYDRFALNASRAWSDIVVTSGRILREEPTLSHEPQGPAGEIRALNEWRQAVAGRGDSATLILTSGRGLDPAHPIFESSRRVIVFTASHAVARVTGVLRHVNAVVIGDDRPSPRCAVEYLRSEAGFRAISIELGPSSSVALYDHPAMVDELWLTIYSGTVPPSVRGNPFLDIPRIRRILPRESDRFVPAGAGPWSFYRFRRD